jgi:hypothetical protein
VLSDEEFGKKAALWRSALRKHWKAKKGRNSSQRCPWPRVLVRNINGAGAPSKAERKAPFLTWLSMSKLDMTKSISGGVLRRGVFGLEDPWRGLLQFKIITFACQANALV